MTNQTNYTDFASLVDANGDVTALGDDLAKEFAGFADLCASSDGAKSEGGYAIVNAAMEAGATFETHGISVDPRMLLGALAAKNIKPVKNDTSRDAFKSKLMEYHSAITTVLIEPVAKAYVRARGPAFQIAQVNAETMSKEDLAALDPITRDQISSAKSQTNNFKSQLRKLICFGPVLEDMLDRVGEPDSKHRGLKGLKDLMVEVREDLSDCVKEGKHFSVQMARDSIVRCTRTVKADNPLRDAVDKLAVVLRGNAEQLAKKVSDLRDSGTAEDTCSAADLQRAKDILSALTGLGILDKSERGDHGFPWQDDFQPEQDAPEQDAPSEPEEVPAPVDPVTEQIGTAMERAKGRNRKPRQHKPKSDDNSGMII